ncbi:MAG: hypothetical protein IT427_10530 [Pirellulales bacterium]|nr:hypothetical protein [Pirellulales bacterium]
MPWQPTVIQRFNRAYPTSACTAQIVTDAGIGYLKALESPEGRHTLVCELVGTRLAQWFELPTFDYSIIRVDADAIDIPLLDQHQKQIGMAQSGSAFITRAENGDSWSGKTEQLNKLVNPNDIGRLIVFDTWTLNCDRHCDPPTGTFGKPRINRNNVFLSEEAPSGQFMLKAIDHTHCFTCGGELTTKLLRDDKIKEPRVFGAFAEFWPLLTQDDVMLAVQALRSVNQTVADNATARIPGEWDLSEKVRQALAEFIVRRAAFVSDTIFGKLWPQAKFDFDDVVIGP